MLNTGRVPGLPPPRAVAPPARPGGGEADKGPAQQRSGFPARGPLPRVRWAILLDRIRRRGHLLPARSAGGEGSTMIGLSVRAK